MYLWFYILRPKRVVLFPEIAWIKSFLSLTCPHSRMCIRIYILNFKKQTNKQNNNNNKKNKNTKKAKETKEENNISGKSIKRKIAAVQVKIFLVTRMSGDRIFFGLMLLYLYTYNYRGSRNKLSRSKSLNIRREICQFVNLHLKLSCPVDYT